MGAGASRRFTAGIEDIAAADTVVRHLAREDLHLSMGVDVDTGVLCRRTGAGLC